MAVSFLQSLKESVYPEILSLVDARVAKVLDSAPEEPFQDENVNEQFLHFSEAVYSSKYCVDEAKKKLKSALMNPKKEGVKLDVKNHQKLMDAATQIHERVQWIVDQKLKTTEKEKGVMGLPRIIRLARRYKMTESETRVLVYCLVCQACQRQRQYSFDRESMGSHYLRSDTLSVCQACDTPLAILVDFLSSEKEHIQQGLFSDSEHDYGRSSSSVYRSGIEYEETACKALIGCQLKSGEFLRLEQTCLAEVIAEESGGDRYRSEGTAKSQPAGESEKGEGDEKTSGGVDVDLDVLLRTERLKEKELKEQTSVDESETAEEEGSGEDLKPYKTDLEYLDHNFQRISQKLKIKHMIENMETREFREMMYGNTAGKSRNQMKKREADAKLKVLEKGCERRLALTKLAGKWIPRLERMVLTQHLSDFEKNVLLSLIAVVLVPDKILLYLGLDSSGRLRTGFTAGDLLRDFCPDLASQIAHRVYFYKSAPMVRDGMVIVHTTGLSGDPTVAEVEIDRRMLDFCVGLDTEFSEVIDGSHLYYPKTKFDSVILSKEIKALLMQTVSSFETYKMCRKRMKLDDAITYGSGMVILFYGQPGTGKTMMANALANKLGKKVLLINFPSLGYFKAAENFKFVFREAKINDAVLFFDECEGIFETRERGSHGINMLLTEIERHDGLIIMATNRPYDLDEAMHRRIMLAIEFRKPDHLLRNSIWKSHIVESMPLADDVDTNELALRYELTGGFIKNAVLSALSIAVSRDGEHPVVNQSDLLKGANMQLRGHLRIKDFDRRVVPSCGLDEVIVNDDLAKSLRAIVSFEKARSVMFGQWGFGKRMSQGITALFHGLPGTGKSLSAEAIGYEVGRALKVVNCAELLSKWVGQSSKNIDAIFEDGKNSDAILVFDEAEGLFGSRTSMGSSSDRYANVDVSVLLYHIERYAGIVILTTNLIDNIDKAFFRRLKFVLRFTTPSQKLRAQMWKLLIPSEAPLSEGVDFERLAEYEMAGGDIQGAIFKAASVAALRPEKERYITMDDLESAAEVEISKTDG